MGTARVGLAQKEDRKRGGDQSHIFTVWYFFLPL
jgi:hypothetical protein